MGDRFPQYPNRDARHRRYQLPSSTSDRHYIIPANITQVRSASSK